MLMSAYTANQIPSSSETSEIVKRQRFSGNPAGLSGASDDKLFVSGSSDITSYVSPSSLFRKAAVDPPIRSLTGFNLPPSICTIRLDGFFHGRNHLVAVIETSPITKRAADGGGTRLRKAVAGGVHYLVQNDSFAPQQWEIAISPLLTFRKSHSLKFYSYAQHIELSFRAVKVRRLLCRASMTFRVVRTNQYNQDLGLIHSTNGNHLESPNEDSSIDHQVTIHLHAQNITMFPTNETGYFASQMLVSSSGGLILILMAQSTRNEFRMHSDY
ncbi:hypothetical protein F511_41447 [Dorcoceras hygrometricum]|uniref:Uncharacterized protein n=1 Tax=Dorcoceras hygrometricum TaxID=472368 RepID=A0A2Z7CES8_9LAMI|nr:hypothetical protein F511_41447 [Dorcoceras hygrometricum]